jgi:hypothetical protein
MVGPHIVAEKNGIPVLSVKDVIYATGNPMLFGYITGGAVTDFTFDNILAGTVASPYRYTWVGPIAGLTFKCLHPQDASGNENPDPNAYICVALTGIAPTIDTAPIVISNPQPVGELPAGTTERDISGDLDKPGSCRASVTDIPYDQMTDSDQMAVVNLKASKLVTGLTKWKNWLSESKAEM